MNKKYIVRLTAKGRRTLREIIKKLKALADAAPEVLLATDEDREVEPRGWATRTSAARSRGPPVAGR